MDKLKEEYLKLRYELDTVAQIDSYFKYIDLCIVIDDGDVVSIC